MAQSYYFGMIIETVAMATATKRQHSDNMSGLFRSYGNSDKASIF